MSKYTIYDDFENEFFELFKNHEDPNFINISDAQLKPQVWYLFLYLKNLGCKSILVENEYVDHDYLDDYTNYYAKCFKPYNKHCKRVHFWADNIRNANISGLILNCTKAQLKKLEEEYLGFVVLKPLPETIIGRTVLKPYNDVSNRVFDIIKNYKVNIFGLEFNIKSLASQEQDSITAACATTALWIAFQKTTDLFNTYSPTPSEITKSATKYLYNSRPIPSTGLNVEQICLAITEYRLTPEVYNVNDNLPVNSLVYAYLKAEIPVILGYENITEQTRHAVTITGYRLEEDPYYNAEIIDDDLDFNLIGRKISTFYVNDDNLGPFSRLQCNGNNCYHIKENKYNNRRIFVRDFTVGRYNEYKECIPQVIILPVYHKIRLKFSKIYQTVREFDKYLKALNFKSDIKDESMFSWDISLMQLKELKNIIRLSPNISREQKTDLLLSNLPRFNWISKASYKNDDWFILISDATDLENTFCVRDILYLKDEVKETLKYAIKHGDEDFKVAYDAELNTNFIKFLKDNILN